MKIWRPKDPRAVALIKICLWAGLATWMVFTFAGSMAVARWAAVGLPGWLTTLGSSPIWIKILTWVIPIWIVFTILMLIWAVARFAVRKLSPRKPIEEREDSE